MDVTRAAQANAGHPEEPHPGRARSLETARSSTSEPELHLGTVDDSDDTPEAPEAVADDRGRRPWHEGPDDEVVSESWLGLVDDELLHKIEKLDPEEGADDRLMEIVRGDTLGPFDRSIDVHVSRIRAAIEDDPKRPRRLLTVRGVGYVLTPASEGDG